MKSKMAVRVGYPLRVDGRRRAQGSSFVLRQQEDFSYRFCML
jgi:hypothetical protein